MGMNLSWFELCCKWSLWTIDQNFTQIIKQLLGSVLRAWELEQLRMLVDEISVQNTVEEFLERFVKLLYLKLFNVIISPDSLERSTRTGCLSSHREF